MESRTMATMEAEADAAALRRAFNKAAESYPQNLTMSATAEKILRDWWQPLYAAITSTTAGLEMIGLVANLQIERDKLAEKCAALQCFKDYVHLRLTMAGVPEDPESPHKSQGCRIGGRLDVVFDEMERLKSLVTVRVDPLTGMFNLDAEYRALGGEG